jgi:hypothetical protein
MKDARKHPPQSHRYIMTALAFLVAAMSGVALTFRFSSGLKPGLYLSDDGIGRVEALRLPIGARRYADVKSFVIGMGGADDYGRVYLNNYIVLNREATGLPYSDKDTPANRLVASAKIVDRKVNKLGDLEAREYLQEGRNIIVIELENAVGPCETRVDIRVNGVQLERFPMQLPDNFQVDREVVNQTLFQKFKKAAANSVLNSLDFPDFMDDVTCARRAFQFTLD